MQIPTNRLDFPDAYGSATVTAMILPEMIDRQKKYKWTSEPKQNTINLPTRCQRKQSPNSFDTNQHKTQEDQWPHGVVTCLSFPTCTIFCHWTWDLAETRDTQICKMWQVTSVERRGLGSRGRLCTSQWPGQNETHTHSGTEAKCLQIPCFHVSSCSKLESDQKCEQEHLAV